MVVIPPQMSDRDECYKEVMEYVAACIGFDCIREDYFRDDKGNIWRGRLCYPPYPDGSQKYIVDIESEAGKHQ